MDFLLGLWILSFVSVLVFIWFDLWVGAALWTRLGREMSTSVWYFAKGGLRFDLFGETNIVTISLFVGWNLRLGRSRSLSVWYMFDRYPASSCKKFRNRFLGKVQCNPIWCYEEFLIRCDFFVLDLCCSFGLKMLSFCRQR